MSGFGSDIQRRAFFAQHKGTVVKKPRKKIYVSRPSKESDVKRFMPEEKARQYQKETGRPVAEVDE